MCVSGDTSQHALEVSVDYMQEKTGGAGGCIALDATGRVGVCFTTEGMSWASIHDGQVHQGIYRGEDIVEPYAG